MSEALFAVGDIVRVKSTGQGGRVAEVRDVAEPRRYAAGDGAFVFVVRSLVDGGVLRTFVGAELEAAPELVEREDAEHLAVIEATKDEPTVPWEEVRASLPGPEADAIGAAAKAIDDANKALAPYGMRIDAKEMATRFKDCADARNASTDPWDVITSAFSLIESDKAVEASDLLESAIDAPPPVPMFLTCPKCNARHIDEGDFATKRHHTHSCQACGLTWRPAVGPTVGVAFLPGFKNEPATPTPSAATCPENGGPHVPDDTHAAHCSGCGAWLGDGLRALCTKAPPGWSCSRDQNHDGPCAARPSLGLSEGGVVTRLLPTTNEVLASLAEEIEAGFATRDTNDGSTFCSQCGAPQPKAPKRKWRHDPSCVVATIRARIGTWGRSTPFTRPAPKGGS